MTKIVKGARTNTPKKLMDYAMSPFLLHVKCGCGIMARNKFLGYTFNDKNIVSTGLVANIAQNNKVSTNWAYSNKWRCNYFAPEEEDFCPKAKFIFAKRTTPLESHFCKLSQSTFSHWIWAFMDLSALSSYFQSG